MAPPKVTIGIPLYRSNRFLDCIAGNIESIDYPNLEIILSDRHLHDDALERVAARFPGDPRLRLLATRDGRGWIDNYNLLLRSATGAYFMWMGHDDELSPGYVGELVAHLEASPETLVAYGDVEVTDESGAPLGWQPDARLLLGEGEAWSVRAALRQLVFRPSFTPPFKGIFRVEPVRGAGLYLREPLDGVWADVYWIFALGLLGRPGHVPSARLRKRVYRTSASAAWGGIRLRDVASGHAILLSYIRDFASGPRVAAEAAAVVSAWSLARAVAATPIGWPLRGRGVARRFLARALSTPVSGIL